MDTLRHHVGRSSVAILDTLFPPVCAGCGRRGHWVCDGCRRVVAALGEPACDRCGALATGRCTCAALPDAVISIRSALPFEGWVRQAIHSLKYEGERARARHLGHLLGPLIPTGAPVHAVVPVPLHPRRLGERGFNQATLLARPLSASLADVPIVEIARTGSTKPQVGLEAAERATNVVGAFVVPEAGLVAGRNLVLVDDVITTSATMAACAVALALGGATTIICVSVARAV